MKRFICTFGLIIIIAPFIAVGQTVTTLVPTNVGDDLHFGTDGFLYSSHYGGVYIRKINPITGQVDSILTASTSTIGAIEMDENLTIYTCSWDFGWLGKFNEGESVVSYLTTGLAGPAGISSDTSGNLYVATNQVHQIVQIKPDGQQQIYFDGSPLFWPTGITSDRTGNLYVANMFTGEIIKIDTDQQAEVLTQLPSDGNNEPDVAYLTWSNNRLFVCHIRDHVIYQINPQTGDKEIIAGTGQAGHDDGPALSATFELPTGIAASPSGDTLFITDGESPNQRLRMLVFETASSTTNKSIQDLPISGLYPLPCADNLKLEINLNKSIPLAFQISDANGKVWHNIPEKKYQEASHEFAFDLSGLPSGSYILTIKSGQYITSKLFLKE